MDSRRGAFGVVHRVEHKQSGKVLACKTIKKKVGSTSSYEQIMREINIMKVVCHDGIVQIKEVYESPKKVALIME